MRKPLCHPFSAAFSLSEQECLHCLFNICTCKVISPVQRNRAKVIKGVQHSQLSQSLMTQPQHVYSSALRFSVLVSQINKRLAQRCEENSLKKNTKQPLDYCAVECQTSQKVSVADVNRCIPFTYWRKNRSSTKARREAFISSIKQNPSKAVKAGS